MKNRISLVVVISFIVLLFSGCIRERPEHLPGMKEDDVEFVWVCENPFSYFVVDKVELSKGYPCLKGYIMKENEFSCFYMHEELNVISCFVEEKLWDSTRSSDAVRGHTKYYEDYFEFEAEHDLINFFDGELPELRFDKMAKKDFLEQYGEIKNVSELLE